MTTDTETDTDPTLDREAIFTAAYDELRRLAHRQRRRERSHTLNSTALVHEAFLKLQNAPTMRGFSKAHLRGILANAMRQVLVDAARRRQAQKRGGDGLDLTYDDGAYRQTVRAGQVEALHEALERLAEISPRQAKVVELRFFGGFTVQETAEALGVSRSTVEEDWRVARAWLADQLRDGGEG